MRKTLIALAAAAGLGVFAGTAAADPGGYVPPQPGAGGGGFTQMGGPGTLLGAGDATGRAPDRYGWNPIFKRFTRSGNCGTCGQAAQAAPVPNGPMQGTLVFPNHTYVRSPRDYFMMDLNK
ncbi:unnamed protein product [Gemmataceae bacterium]|nr:unnamed protein product [Gemmataceae bacterium]VTT98960.1 unnamed protein product [Gemmataceae bacterium]